MADERSEIRRKIDLAGEHLGRGDVPGALNVLMPGVPLQEIEQRAAAHAQALSKRVRQVQARTLGVRPIDPSGSRGVAQTMSVYIRTFRDMHHSDEDVGMLANLLSDLQFGNLSRRLPPEVRNRLLAAIIHAVVEHAPET